MCLRNTGHATLVADGMESALSWGDHVDGTSNLRSCGRTGHALTFREVTFNESRLALAFDVVRAAMVRIGVAHDGVDGRCESSRRGTITFLETSE